MVEIFKYTERVVNMVRPRKLLFMAIGELRCLMTVLFAYYYERWCRPSC